MPRATNLVGEALVIADRAEILVGIWGIGLKPTGDKDPFALRRHALTLIDSFRRVAGGAAGARSSCASCSTRSRRPSTFRSPPTVVVEVEAFIYERYFQQLAAAHDTRAVDAVISLRPALHDVAGRVLAVREFLALPEAPALAAANKRVGNILKKSDAAAAAVDPALLGEPAEQALAAALARRRRARRPGLRARASTLASLRLLAGLKPSVDAFFDNVMVNVDSRAAARQPPRAAGGAASDDEPRRRPVAPGRLRGSPP